jgi:predicted transcriptional regulator
MSDSPKSFVDVIGMLTHDCHVYALEVARLKSEVKRLKNNCDYLDKKLDEELNKSAMLGEQVERLTDAITRGACIPDAKAE